MSGALYSPGGGPEDPWGAWPSRHSVGWWHARLDEPEVFPYQDDGGGPGATAPREFQGLAVPAVLLSGNHEKIRRFREKEA